MGIHLLTEHTVAEAAVEAGIDVRPYVVDVTGSTNSDLLEMADHGAPEWTVLVTGHQEAGRGRLGRTWASAPGRSLLASVLLRPDLPATEVPILGLAAAVAMSRAIESACGVEVGCKWPNDLLVGDRKLGGILSEATFRDGRPEHVVIGVGVNVRQLSDEFPPELRGSATSVVIEGGLPDARAVLTEYLRSLRSLVGRSEAVVPAYRSVCRSLGRRVRATVSTGATVEGLAVDVGSSGELLVEGSGEVRAVGFGDIVHLA